MSRSFSLLAGNACQRAIALAGSRRKIGTETGTVRHATASTNDTLTNVDPNAGNQQCTPGFAPTGIGLSGVTLANALAAPKGRSSTTSASRSPPCTRPSPRPWRYA
ncbi:MAG: hypothetical protein QE285_02245 [Aquabacterium sp.]|nr:hypothetical protein [Aquabacterium sp.]